MSDDRFRKWQQKFSIAPPRRQCTLRGVFTFVFLLSVMLGVFCGLDHSSGALAIKLVVLRLCGVPVVGMIVGVLAGDARLAIRGAVVGCVAADAVWVALLLLLLCATWGWWSPADLVVLLMNPLAPLCVLVCAIAAAPRGNRGFPIAGIIGFALPAGLVVYLFFGTNSPVDAGELLAIAVFAIWMAMFTLGLVASFHSREAPIRVTADGRAACDAAPMRDRSCRGTKCGGSALATFRCRIVPLSTMLFTTRCVRFIT